jgi:hypothetical protein
VTDARFADAADRPLRLTAETAEDLAVMATLAQDAVGRAADAAWLGRRRRFVAVMNRFRWEDKAAAERQRRPYERVRAALSVENVMAVRARGVPQGQPGAVFNLLDLLFEPGEDGTGTIRLILSGDAEIALSVEAIDVALRDLSRPWATVAAPAHRGGD